MVADPYCREHGDSRYRYREGVGPLDFPGYEDLEFRDVPQSVSEPVSEPEQDTFRITWDASSQRYIVVPEGGRFTWVA